jgi:hypothetical protein
MCDVERTSTSHDHTAQTSAQCNDGIALSQLQEAGEEEEGVEREEEEEEEDAREMVPGVEWRVATRSMLQLNRVPCGALRTIKPRKGGAGGRNGGAVGRNGGGSGGGSGGSDSSDGDDTIYADVCDDDPRLMDRQCPQVIVPSGNSALR